MSDIIRVVQVICDIFIYLREPNPNLQHVNKPFRMNLHEVKGWGLIIEGGGGGGGVNRGFTV